MSDESIVAAVSAANAKAHIEHITTQIPSRLAGSANGKRMAEYSASALTKAGVSAKVHEMPGLVSFPEKAEMRVLAPVELSIEANTLGHSLPTLPDGISAELMDVASGAFSEYEGRTPPARSRSRSSPITPRATRSSASPRSWAPPGA